LVHFEVDEVEVAGEEAGADENTVVAGEASEERRGRVVSYQRKSMEDWAMGIEGLVGPVVLRPIFQERIWGVERLPEFYQQPEAGKPIGEAWLTAETCVAASGVMEGKTLAEMAKEAPEKFAGPEFPLLIKMLFPKEKLSVQVHPNDAEAKELGQSRGKTECWYVLEAEPGAAVALGFKKAISLAEVKAGIEDKTLEAKLNYVPVKAGDMVFVDAGTVHAIGPGMVVLETQQYSDVTYRLYDYGRPRELHVDAGLAVSKVETLAGLVKPVAMEGFTRLVGCDYFVVDRFEVRGEAPLVGASGMQMVVALEKGMSVGQAELPPGSVVLLPAEGVSYVVKGSGTVVRIAQGS
jgi:mannose-6-phosphate isomerase